MVTAWSPRRIGGTRSGAGPLPRLVALAVLLFGVLLSHGASVESVQGHLSTSAMAPVAAQVTHGSDAAAETDDHRGGHEPSHPGEQCAAGQPQQSSVSGTPCFAASVGASTSAEDASAARVPAAGESSDGDAPAALRAASVVRQV